LSSTYLKIGERGRDKKQAKKVKSTRGQTSILSLFSTPSVRARFKQGAYINGPRWRIDSTDGPGAAKNAADGTQYSAGVQARRAAALLPSPTDSD
jgi:hypothetical protein